MSEYRKYGKVVSEAKHDKIIEKQLRHADKVNKKNVMKQNWEYIIYIYDWKKLGTTPNEKSLKCNTEKMRTIRCIEHLALGRQNHGYQSTLIILSSQF